MKNNLINISKSLLLFGIIANSTMNLVKAEESKSKETNSSKNIIWTQVNNKTYKTLDKKIEVLEVDETPAYGLETKVKVGINGVVECK